MAKISSNNTYRPLKHKAVAERVAWNKYRAHRDEDTAQHHMSSCLAAAVQFKVCTKRLTLQSTNTLQTQLYLKPYLRSPTNNILTSLRIFPGVVNHVGRSVCVQHLCSCLSGWRIQPATSTRPGSLANSYVRISAPVCSASTQTPHG